MAPVPPIQIATLGMADSLILMVLALVVFGPRRLPQIGRQIGKLMYEFRKASNDFKFQMEEELRLSEEADRRKKEEAERAARAATLPAPTQTIDPDTSATPSAEPESVSAQPANSYPAAYPAETSATPAEPESHGTTPRTVPVIQPPSTGEQVQAARPGAAAVVGPNAALAVEPQSTTASKGTEPAAPASPQDPNPSETVRQHG
jgi:sec-independent protein translocase protein TatB